MRMRAACSRFQAPRRGAARQGRQHQLPCQRRAHTAPLKAPNPGSMAHLSLSLPKPQALKPVCRQGARGEAAVDVLESVCQHLEWRHHLVAALPPTVSALLSWARFCMRLKLCNIQFLHCSSLLTASLSYAAL